MVPKRTIYLKSAVLSILLVAFFLTSSNQAQAQQDPQFSFYMFNKLTYNPAYAGAKDNWYSSLILRNQWMGFEGHPVTQSITTHTPIGRKKRIGMGLHILNDQLGADRFTYGMFSLAWRKPTNAGVLSIGANAGIAQNALDGALLRSSSGNYDNGQLLHNDPKIPAGNENATVPDLGAGIYFDAPSFYLGASMLHLLESEVELTTSGGTVAIPIRMNMYITGGYQAKLNQDYAIKSHMLVKTDMTKAQFDIDAMLDYRDQLWFGAGMRGVGSDNRDAVILNMGMAVSKTLTFGYAYDITTSAISNYSSGTHEFMLTYLFARPTAPPVEKIIKSPRFL